METVKQWAMTVAISSVAGAIVLMLAPDGTVKKSVRTAVSLFLIVVMISPFVKGIELSDFDIEFDTQYEQPDMSDTVAQQMKAALTKKVDEILTECGIKSAQINIDVSVDGENMTVDKIEIVADSGDFATAENRIKTEIGADVKIGVSQ